jgi:uncharacterized radical SAM superfamily Fe-S cluster-containing enzyme
MRKRCPEHGWFEALVYNDAQLYASSLKYNKPGTIPLTFSTDIKEGCPHDCGLCPEHQQHTCLGIIEVNTACNFDCPVCFSDAGPGFNLTLDEVESILDHFVETEGNPEVVQFSGGEPSIHPDIIPMLRMAVDKGIKYVMLNTNGRRIAQDDAFLTELAQVRPVIYLQFDGFEERTTWTLRRERNLLPEKLRALDRLASAGLDVVLVPTIERGINLREVGAIVKFGVQHPAVKGINLQPMFHAGRHIAADPLQRLTVPDVLRAIDEQCEGMFRADDFVPVPCCFPTCNSVTYAWVDGATVLPITRLVDVDNYLDYLTNRSVPDLAEEIKTALEGLWSATAVPGTDNVSTKFRMACSACSLPALELAELKKRIFMVMITDFMDPWTFNVKNLMKCCKEFLLPDGRQIPFCAYNTVGYREQVRAELSKRRRGERAAHAGG